MSAKNNKWMEESGMEENERNREEIATNGNQNLQEDGALDREEGIEKTENSPPLNEKEKAESKNHSNNVKRNKNYKIVPAQIYDTNKMSTYEKHLALKNAQGELFRWPLKRKREDEEISNQKIQKIDEKTDDKNDDNNNNSSEGKGEKGETLLEYLEKAGYTLTHSLDIKRIRSPTNVQALKQFIQSNDIHFNNVMETSFNAGLSADFFLSHSDRKDDNIIVVSFDRMMNNYSYLSKLYIDINYQMSHLLLVGDTSSSLPHFINHFPDIKFDLIFIDMTNPETSYEKVVNDLHWARERCSAGALIIFDHSLLSAGESSFSLARFSSPPSLSSSTHPPSSDIIADLISNGEIERISPPSSSSSSSPSPSSSTSPATAIVQSKSMPLKERSQQRVIAPPTPPSIANHFASGESIDEFLQRAGYDLRNDIEGHSKWEHFEKFEEVLKHNRHIKSITEIGFNAGHSAQFFLQKLIENNPQSVDDIQMVSFDIILHDYCFYSKTYIDSAFPNKHLLIAGDSNEAVQIYHSLNPRTFDLIFIDGDHTYHKALLDIENMKHLAHKDTILIIDNVAPHRGVGIQVFEAMQTAVENKLFIYDEHVEVGDFADGFAIGRYYFGDEAEGEERERLENEFEQSLIKFQNEIPLMKRRVAICELNKIIDQLQPQHVDEWIICIIAFELLKDRGVSDRMDKGGERNREWVDSWAMNSISRKRNFLSRHLFKVLDDLYFDLDGHPIMKCKYTTHPKVLLEHLQDVSPLINTYQKLRCGMASTMARTGGKGDRDFQQHKRRLEKAWRDVDQLVDDEIFRFLQSYLSRNEQSGGLEKIRDWLDTYIPQRRERVYKEIDAWLSSFLSFDRYQLSTKTSTLIDSAAFQNLLLSLNHC